MHSIPFRHRFASYLAVVLLGFFGFVPRAHCGSPRRGDLRALFADVQLEPPIFPGARGQHLQPRVRGLHQSAARRALGVPGAVYGGLDGVRNDGRRSANPGRARLQNQCFSNYDTGSMFNGTVPPSGTYHAVLFVAEYIAGSGNSYDYDDYGLLPDFITVSGGVFTVGAAPVGCTPDSQTLCLDDVAGDGRFQVRTTFNTTQGGGQSGFGTPVPLSTLGVGRGGLLWFFSASTPEVLVKVINGCALNNRYWVFASAGTNVGVSMTVTDTVAHTSKTYTNPDLQAWAPVQDTAAFPCQ